MSNCPKCMTQIKFMQILKSNIWAPIVCSGCMSKLKINDKEYNIKVLPIISVAVFIILTNRFLSADLKNLKILALSAELVLFGVFLGHFFWYLKSPKFDLKN